MAKVVKYKVWVHIEGLDRHGDCVEGDDYYEPMEAGCFRTVAEAERLRGRLLEVAGTQNTERKRQMENEYWAYRHNIEECLRNGSFVRRSRYGLAQFNNGDFMGFVNEVPPEMEKVETSLAKSLIPECCR